MFKRFGATHEPLSMSLLPISALLRREILSSLRRPRAILLVGGATAAFVAWFLYMLPRGEDQETLYDPADVLNTIGVGLVALTLLMLPPLTIINVREEKHQQTIDLLVMTLIRPGFILCGKLFSTCVLFFLTLVALLPILGVSFFFVGIDTAEFATLFARLLLAAVLAVALAALAAVSFENFIQACVFSYFILFFANLIPMCMMMDSGAVGVAYGRAPLFLASLAFVLIVSVIALHTAAELFLRITAPAPPSQERPIDNPVVLNERRGTYPFYLIDPRRRKPPVGDNENAVFRREVITSPFQATIRIRLAMGYALFTVPIFTFTSFERYEASLNMVSMFLAQAAFLTFLCPAFAATLMVKEHEQDNLDMLRMTLLTPGEILRGKLMAGISFIAPILIAPLLAVLMVFLLDPNPLLWLGRALVLWLGMVTFSVFLVALTMTATLACRRTPTALVAAFLAPVLVVAVVPFLLRDTHVLPWFLLALWPTPFLLPSLVPELSQVLTGADTKPLYWVVWCINQFGYLALTLVFMAFCRHQYQRHLLRDK